MAMIFRGWQKTSLMEYPGKVSTVLFTGGCNFRCPFCYNRDVVLSPEKFPKITEKEVLDFLKARKGLYQGVIVTGGEPTMHEDLPDFFWKIRELGISPALETNGTSYGMLKKLLKEGLVDFVAMDIKAPLVWEKYRIATGTENMELFNNVLKSVKLLMESGIDYEFRTTVVPVIHQTKDILDIAQSINGAKKYVLQQFAPKGSTIDPRFAEAPPYPDSFITNIGNVIRKKFSVFEIRNTGE